MRFQNWATGLLAVIFLVACQPVAEPATDAPPQKTAAQPPASKGEARPEWVPVSPEHSQMYYDIAQRIEPVARRNCREAGLPNCNFTFLTDIAQGRPSNAWQTRDGTRPFIIVSLPFFNEVANADELAFVLGHEAAHHILNHQPRGRVNVQEAALTGALDALRDGRNVEEAHERGALQGRLAFSQEFELEADALGARMAFEAGFDPARGALYFERRLGIRSQVHSTHPPNARRLANVRRVIAGLQ